MVFASFVCRAAGALALAAGCSAHAADLTLTIEGVNAAEGRVAAAAYDSAGSWLKGPPAFEDAAVDVQGDTALTIHLH